MNKVVVIWTLLSTLLFAADPVLIRSSVQPEEAWQGQRVQLVVEVLGKESWAQIPNIPALKVAGAYVLPAASQGVRAQEFIDGAQYTGQRYELSVYPQKGGKIEIPETPVEVRLKSFGSGEGEKQVQLAIPKASFQCKVPPGAEGVQWLVSTSAFNATQTWSSDATELKVGDALKRTISLTANDVSGMAFQPLEFPAMDGLGIYPAEPSVQDKRDRGTLSGTRDEEVSYIFQGGGTVKIPAIELVWWDLQNEKLNKVVLEGKEIVVKGGAPVSYTEEKSGTDSRGFPWFIVWLGLGVGVLAGWKHQAILTFYHSWKKERSESEKVYFGQFANAAGTRDIRQTQAALMQWLDRINTSDSPAQMGAFLERYADTDVSIDVLLNDPTTLYSIMVKARQKWLKASKQRAKADALLPELNG